MLLEMGLYLSSLKKEKAYEDGKNDWLRYGLSSMQAWRRTMEDAHAAYPDLDESTSFFGVYDGHGGKAVSKFCAKYRHQQVLKHEAYLAGDLGTSVQNTFLRMDGMICGQRGRRELAVFGEKSNKFFGMRNWFIRTPKGGAANGYVDDWAFEEGPHCGFRGPKAGCTACVAVVVVANAADSRCVLSRKGQGTMFYAHIFYNGLKGGDCHSCALDGDIEFKENEHLPAEKQMVTSDPELTSVELCDDDEFLVIACDGICINRDCMSSQHLVDFIHEQLKTENDLKVVCERVLDWRLAPAAGGLGCDNMTMILIQFKRPSNSGGDSIIN